MPIFNMGPCYLLGLQPSDIQWSANGTSGWTSMPNAASTETDNYNFYYNATTHNWLLGVKVTSYIRFLKAPSTTGLSTVLVGGGGGGGRGNSAPSTNDKQCGGGGGAGGAVVQPNITYAKNTVYKINIGAGGAGSSSGNGSAGGATSLVNNSTSTTLSTAAAGSGGKGATYDSNANPNPSATGNGGKGGTHTAAATNGGNGTLIFSTSYLGCGWENVYVGAGGGGGSGGYWKNWNGQKFTYDSTNPGTGGGNGCGGNGGGKIGYTGHQQWNNNGYYDYWVTPNPTTVLNATVGKASFGGGGGGGGSCALGSGSNQRNNRPGAAGGSGIFIIRSIVTP